MPLHINYEKKKIIATRFKSGSSSVDEHIRKHGNNQWIYENSDVLVPGSTDDDYTWLEFTIPDIKKWEIFYVARNPIDYTVSGYKHYWWQHKTNYFCKHAINRLVDEYTFPRHVLLISDIFLQYEMSKWRDSHTFFTHCASTPIRHWRPWMNLVKLETDFKNLHTYVDIDTPFPHENSSETFKGKIEMNDAAERLLRTRWTYTANQWGYDIDESINKYK